MAREDRTLTGPFAATGALSGVRLDAVVTAIQVWSITGVVLDVRSHVAGFDFAEEGFLTPEHAMFYSGFLALAALVAAVSVRRYREGASLGHAPPVGYRLGAVGLVVFALGGPGDLLWHTAFGAESDVEALVSPTHLALATGGVLFATAPLRATLARGGESGWRQAPAVVGLLVAAALAALFSLYAQPAFVVAGAGGTHPAVGLAAVLWQAVLVGGVVAYYLTRLRPTVGAGTLLVGSPVAAVAVVGGSPALAVPAVVAGLLLDAAVWAGVATGSRRRLLGAVAGTTALVTAGQFAAVAVTAGLAWSIHLWAGAVYLAACVGALVGLLAVPAGERRSESI
ncbi:hypothetical protein [Halorarius halobius]|uniref:hypothetical protein n=1 Tax=Halorarius halobius TaxID=2962671 RepID=UPI0020CC8405|nr:hypothetical protein [Halorarius halobius]